MSRVFVNIGLSLDGYMAPEGMTIEQRGSPEYEDWGAKWGAMMGSIMKTQYFRRDVHISGGANAVQQYLNLGVIDELEIALAPVLFGAGRRLFENLQEPVPRFRMDAVVEGSAATHLRYVRD